MPSRVRKNGEMAYGICKAVGPQYEQKKNQCFQRSARPRPPRGISNPPLSYIPCPTVEIKPTITCIEILHVGERRIALAHAHRHIHSHTLTGTHVLSHTKCRHLPDSRPFRRQYTSQFPPEYDADVPEFRHFRCCDRKPQSVSPHFLVFGCRGTSIVAAECWHRLAKTGVSKRYPEPCRRS